VALKLQPVSSGEGSHLKKSLSLFGVVLLFSSMTVAAQSTTTPVPAAPKVQSKPAKAPPQKQRLKESQKRGKKPATPPPSPPPAQ
jgi:hypothetical protein